MSWLRAVPRRRLLLAAASVATIQDPVRQKLSIYPAVDEDVVVVDSPSQLETQIGVARRAATGVFNNVHGQVQGVISKWIGLEQAVEHRVKSIIAPDEPLTPGLLYVGVASLTGSIFARNRFILTRLFLPPTLFFLSLDYFLPKTSHNLSEYFGSLEDTYFPTFAAKHEIAKAHTGMTWERVKDASHDGRLKFEAGLGSVVKKIQEVTGLKVEEALGQGKVTVTKVAKEVESKALDVVKDAGNALRPAEQKVEKKADETKHLV
ncbi:hypothetical protein BV25DRAFT_1989730 [Artomyces pyxidatus]|uniref:Uncharacterized protein n=1 Tax=Artomyces pyxidatus TaxID=48021 RepID=A0ACB8T897_9AGAM|nr:hypothetical protein BV25DRAFT_1989730 [Artomyces pyxidatus]